LLIERDPRAGTIEGGLVWLHNGNRVGVDGYYGRFSEILIINRGVHEPLEEFVFQELLRTMPVEPIMLELGAYWGHYSMWMKARRPRSKVFLVEPDLGNLETGRSNFARNGFEGEFIHAAVGHGHFEVDSFLGAREYQELTVLHCDIQGFESEMLDGCKQSLERGIVKYALVSTHSQPLHEEVEARLSASGMRVDVSCGFVETTSYDGFIFASRKDVAPILEEFRPIGRRDILDSSPSKLISFILSSQQKNKA